MSRLETASASNTAASGGQAVDAALPAESVLAPQSGWRRKLMLAVRGLVVAVIFSMIFRTVNIGGLAARLNAAMAWTFAAGVIMLLGQAGVCTARWRMLLETDSPRPGFADSFRAFIEGAFFNEALPSTLGGDAWRVVRWRAAGVSLRAATASVLVDRLSGAMGAAVLAMLASVVLAHYGEDVRWTVPLFLLALAVILGSVTFIVLSRQSRLPFRRFVGIHDAIAKLQGSLVLDRRYVTSLAYSVVGHSISGIAVYATASSLDIHIPLLLTVSVTAAMLLIVMVPISLAGWGIREASFIALLAPFGVNNQDALLIGILFGLMSLVSSLGGGLSFLLRRGAAVGRFRQANGVAVDG